MAKANRVSKDLLEESLIQEINNKRSKDDMVDWSMIANKPQLADGSWKPPVQEPANLPLTGNSDGDIRLTLGSEKYVFTWSKANNQWMLIGANDTSVDWAHLTNKPVSFPPSGHQHKEADITDLDKYTKSETDAKLATKSNDGHTHAYSSLTGIPLTFQPVSHTHTESDIIGLDKYTKAEVDTKLTGKANTSHTHTIANVTNLQTTLNTKVDKVTGKGLSTNDYTTAEKDKLNALSDSAQLSYDTLDTAIKTHTANAIIHVTDVDKSLWNLVTDKADKTYVDTQLNTKASASVVTGHVDNTTVHITSTERANWNAKSNFSGKYTDLTSIPATFPATAHTHTWAEVTGKPTTFTPSTHTHSYTDLTNKPDLSIYLTEEDLTSLGAGDMLKSVYDADGDGKIDVAKTAETVNWTGVTGVPTTFTPSVHTHAISDITDLTSQLASKAPASTLTGHTGNATIHVTQTDKDNWNGKLNSVNPIASGTFTLKDTELSVEQITFDGATASGMRVANSNGNVSIAPLNTSGAHIYTNLSRFYFNKLLSLITGVLSSYQTDLFLQRMYVTKLTLGLTQATFADKVQAPSFVQTDGKAIETTDGAQSKIDTHAGNTTLHITSTERVNWNAKSNFSGSYNDLTNKPTIQNYTVSVGTTQPTTDMWYKEV